MSLDVALEQYELTPAPPPAAGTVPQLFEAASADNNIAASAPSSSSSSSSTSCSGCLIVRNATAVSPELRELHDASARTIITADHFRIHICAGNNTVYVRDLAPLWADDGDGDSGSSDYGGGCGAEHDDLSDENEEGAMTGEAGEEDAGGAYMRIWGTSTTVFDVCARRLAPSHYLVVICSQGGTDVLTLRRRLNPRETAYIYETTSSTFTPTDPAQGPVVRLYALPHGDCGGDAAAGVGGDASEFMDDEGEEEEGTDEKNAQTQEHQQQQQPPQSLCAAAPPSRASTAARARRALSRYAHHRHQLHHFLGVTSGGDVVVLCVRDPQRSGGSGSSGSNRVDVTFTCATVGGASVDRTGNANSINGGAPTRWGRDARRRGGTSSNHNNSRSASSSSNSSGVGGHRGGGAAAGTGGSGGSGGGRGMLQYLSSYFPYFAGRRGGGGESDSDAAAGAAGGGGGLPLSAAAGLRRRWGSYVDSYLDAESGRLLVLCSKAVTLWTPSAAADSAGDGEKFQGGRTYHLAGLSWGVSSSSSAASSVLGRAAPVSVVAPFAPDAAHGTYGVIVYSDGSRRSVRRPKQQQQQKSAATAAAAGVSLPPLELTERAGMHRSVPVTSVVRAVCAGDTLLLCDAARGSLFAVCLQRPPFVSSGYREVVSEHPIVYEANSVCPLPMSSASCAEPDAAAFAVYGPAGRVLQLRRVPAGQLLAERGTRGTAIAGCDAATRIAAEVQTRLRRADVAGAALVLASALEPELLPPPGMAAAPAAPVAAAESRRWGLRVSPAVEAVVRLALGEVAALGALCRPAAQHGGCCPSAPSSSSLALGERHLQLPARTWPLLLREALGRAIAGGTGGEEEGEEATDVAAATDVVPASPDALQWGPGLVASFTLPSDGRGGGGDEAELLAMAEARTAQLCASARALRALQQAQTLVWLAALSAGTARPLRGPRDLAAYVLRGGGAAAARAAVRWCLRLLELDDAALCRRLVRHAARFPPAARLAMGFRQTLLARGPEAALALAESPAQLPALAAAGLVGHCADAIERRRPELLARVRLLLAQCRADPARTPELLAALEALTAGDARLPGCLALALSDGALRPVVVDWVERHALTDARLPAYAAAVAAARAAGSGSRTLTGLYLEATQLEAAGHAAAAAALFSGIGRAEVECPLAARRAAMARALRLAPDDADAQVAAFYLELQARLLELVETHLRAVADRGDSPLYPPRAMQEDVAALSAAALGPDALGGMAGRYWELGGACLQMDILRTVADPDPATLAATVTAVLAYISTLGLPAEAAAARLLAEYLPPFGLALPLLPVLEFLATKGVAARAAAAVLRDAGVPPTTVFAELLGLVDGRHPAARFYPACEVVAALGEVAVQDVERYDQHTCVAHLLECVDGLLQQAGLAGAAGAGAGAGAAGGGPHLGSPAAGSPLTRHRGGAGVALVEPEDEQQLRRIRQRLARHLNRV